MFRICIPKVQGRGAGLGNELIPWAKALIAGAELGIPSTHPAWGLNRQRYWQYFGTSRLDWIGHYLAGKALPSFTLTQQDYFATGEKDFGRAIRVFADAKGLNSRSCYVLWVEGMWGGFHSIEKAKPFVWSALYGAKNTAANLWDLSKRINGGHLVVAVHIRLGDFNPAAETSDYRGKFNISIPLSWYVSVCRKLKAAFGSAVQFLLLSNGNQSELRGFIEEFSPITTAHQKNTVCSDLLAMANADLLICSVSTYSMWAAFLSEAPYIWFEPQLQDHDRCYSLWGNEERQKVSEGVTALNMSQLDQFGKNSGLPRGLVMNAKEDVPEEMLKYLEAKIKLKSAHLDLIRYGVVPKNIEQQSSTLKRVK